jgi:hypothetical protein
MEDSSPENDSRPLPPNAIVIHLPILTRGLVYGGRCSLSNRAAHFDERASVLSRVFDLARRVQTYQAQFGVGHQLPRRDVDRAVGQGRAQVQRILDVQGHDQIGAAVGQIDRSATFPSGIARSSTSGPIA